MKVEYINPFVSSTVNLFRTMLDTHLTRRDLYIKDGSQPGYDISGVIGLSGMAKGTVVLSLERDMARVVTEQLLQTQLHSTQITRDVIDAVGELTNILAGGAKAQLAEFQMSVSLPTVITGKGHCIDFPKNSKPICIPFESARGNLEIEVGLVELDPKPTRPRQSGAENEDADSGNVTVGA